METRDYDFLSGSAYDTDGRLYKPNPLGYLQMRAEQADKQKAVPETLSQLADTDMTKALRSKYREAIRDDPAQLQREVKGPSGAGMKPKFVFNVQRRRKI